MLPSARTEVERASARSMPEASNSSCFIHRWTSISLARSRSKWRYFSRARRRRNSFNIVFFDASLVPERNGRIDPRRSARRHDGRSGEGWNQDQDDEAVRNRVEGRQTKNRVAQERGQDRRRRDTCADSPERREIG